MKTDVRTLYNPDIERWRKMEYYGNSYDPNGHGYYRPEKEKKGSVGAIIVTAVICLIVGALLACIILPIAGLYNVQEFGSAALPTPSAKPAAPTAEPDIPAVTATPAPTETAEPTVRPEATLDGSAPSITDPVNPIPEIVEGVSSGIVGVYNYGATSFGGRTFEDSVQGSGTGFVISSEGYVLTNAHVIDGARRVAVVLEDGTEIDAEVIGADSISDVAVLRVDASGLVPLKLGDSDSVRVGEFCIAIGDPTGRELAGTPTFGIISATGREVNIDGQSNEYLQTDAAINPGNSGGPLLNMSGEVIGITSAKTVTASYDEQGNAISAEGLGFAIPINDAMSIVNQLIQSGSIARPGIGISVITITDTYAEMLELPIGALVYSITKDGPGDLAGLEIDDVIVSCNGVDVPDKDVFVQLVRGKLVGDELLLEVWRDGSYINITLTLGDLNKMGDELVEGISIIDSLG